MKWALNRLYLNQPTKLLNLNLNPMSVFCIYYRSVHVKFSIPIFSLGDISHQSIIDTMADIHQNVFLKKFWPVSCEGVHTR